MIGMHAARLASVRLRIFISGRPTRGCWGGGGGGETDRQRETV